MSPKPSPGILVLSDWLYRRLLAAYPASHRREYGPLLSQLWRDQCRDAYRREGPLGVVRLWPWLLLDLVKTSTCEQLNRLERNPLMNKPANPQRLATVLLWAGLASGAMTFLVFGLPLAAGACAYLASAAILGKAVAECFRPRADWWRGLVGWLIIAVAYGFFMPEWARLRHEQGLGYLIQPALLMLPMLANLAVPLIQGLLLLGQARDARVS